MSDDIGKCPTEDEIKVAVAWLDAIADMWMPTEQSFRCRRAARMLEYFGASTLKRMAGG